MTEKTLFRLPEAAERLNVSRATVYRLLNSGRLKAHKLGKTTVVKAEDLAALLDGMEPYTPQSPHKAA